MTSEINEPPSAMNPSRRHSENPTPTTGVTLSQSVSGVIAMNSTWPDILPTPPQHCYATTPPTEVLMRCAERYDLERYTDP